MKKEFITIAVILCIMSFLVLLLIKSATSDKQLSEKQKQEQVIMFSLGYEMAFTRIVNQDVKTIEEYRKQKSIDSINILNRIYKK